MTEREREMRNSKSPGRLARGDRGVAPRPTGRSAGTPIQRRAAPFAITSVSAEVARYREINLRALRAARQLPRLYRAILYCSAVDPCRESLCPHCTSDYRLWLAPELMTLARLGPPAFVATVLLLSVPGPNLPDVDVRALNQLVRKRLIRAGFRRRSAGRKPPTRRARIAGSFTCTFWFSASAKKPSGNCRDLRERRVTQTRRHRGHQRPRRSDHIPSEVCHLP